MTNLKVVVNKFYDEYVSNTPNKLKIIDAYLVYIVLTGVIQFVYCCLVGSFPFNSFLSGFISTISCFILGGLSNNFNLKKIKKKNLIPFPFSLVCLRLQANPQNKLQFIGISPERGFADFILAHVILHIVVMNFLG